MGLDWDRIASLETSKWIYQRKIAWVRPTFRTIIRTCSSIWTSQNKFPPTPHKSPVLFRPSTEWWDFDFSTLRWEFFLWYQFKFQKNQAKNSKKNVANKYESQGRIPAVKWGKKKTPLKLKQAYLSSEPKKPRLITGKADSEEDDENSGAMWIGQDTIFGQVQIGRSWVTVLK